MVNKKLVIIVTIIAIIVVSGSVYISLNREFQEEYTFSEENVENEVENNVQNNTYLKENDIVENKLGDNKVENDIKNEVEKNVVSESQIKENKIEKDDENLAGKDKAISLVKKEWGENDNTVYYYVEEQISDNVYIISVRDQETTQDLSSYKVNVNSECVEKN